MKRKKNGQFKGGENHPGWKGGITLDRKKYYWEYDKNHPNTEEEKEKQRLLLAEKRLDPEYKKREKAQRMIKMETPEEKERRKLYGLKYRQSAKGLETTRKYQSQWNQSEKAKESRKKYKHSDRGIFLRKDRWYKIKYGLDYDLVNKMFLAQNNRCALCGDLFTTERPYVIDHDHETGRVRGLIHRKCNILTGMADDNIQILRLAANYLEKFK